MHRVAALQAKDMISQDAIAQAREDLRNIDDIYFTANEGVQMSGRFTIECANVMAVPAGVKKVWHNAFETQFKKTGEATQNMVAALQEFTGSLRAMLDFTEAHAANISLDKNGKLVFADPDDLATFRTLSTQAERSRINLRDSAKVPPGA